LRVGDRVDSVRELAAKIGVNQNTILRTYMELQNNGIIENQRGIGYFVAANATEIIKKTRKDEFYNAVVPEFIRQARLLQLKKEDLFPLFDQLNDHNYENK
jgi:DNA-binding transcriptional regulator YhcF (GntR family)